MGVILAVFFSGFRSDDTTKNDISTKVGQVQNEEKSKEKLAEENKAAEAKKTKIAEEAKQAEEKKTAEDNNPEVQIKPTEQPKPEEKKQPVVEPQPEAQKPAEEAKEKEAPKEVKKEEPKEAPKEEKKEKPAEKETKKDDSQSKANFSFTAQPGDSYTALARKAVAQYVDAQKQAVTAQQKEQAAAQLAVKAGSPLLEIGQVVTIEKSVVAATVKAVVPPEAKADQVKPVTPKDSKETNALVAEYSFTAVAGDSYSKLARTAIADYASKANLDLSPSQRIAAETAIIASAGFPRLDINQVVTYTSATIKDAVDASMQLTDAQLLNWQPYALLAGL
jgi:hypothetical protein